MKSFFPRSNGLVIRICLSSFLFCCVVSNSTVSSPTVSSPSVSSPTGQVTEAASPSGSCVDYGQISQVVTYLSDHLASIIGGQDNLFFSPFCISLSLAMVYLGARGETAKAMEEGLGYKKLVSDHPQETIHELFQTTLRSIEQAREAYSLEVANGIFVQKGFDISPNYVSDLQRFYTAKVLHEDFRYDGETSILDINSWVANHTAGMIEKLFDEPLDPMTVILLVNAIYFKGFWKHPFNERLTRDNNFYSTDGNAKIVPFMEYKKKVLAFTDDSTNYTFLELDYQGDDVSMVFALPYDRNQFPNLEITTTLMCRVRSNLKTTFTHVMIPKFSLMYERELTNDLFHLGFGELFSEEHANLTGIRHQNDLFVSAMVHKAVIDVNEQGSEASAANGINFTSRSGQLRYKVFKANHPFIFCILDKRSGTILFLGRVVDP